MMREIGGRNGNRNRRWGRLEMLLDTGDRLDVENGDRVEMAIESGRNRDRSEVIDCQDNGERKWRANG